METLLLTISVTYCIVCWVFQTGYCIFVVRNTDFQRYSCVIPLEVLFLLVLVFGLLSILTAPLILPIAFILGEKLN